MTDPDYTQPDYTQPGTPDSSTDTASRSPALAVTGIVALLVALWGLADGPRLATDGSYLPWTLLGVGLVVGIVLIASGFRK